MRTLLFYVMFTLLCIINIVVNLVIWIVYLPSDFIKAQKCAFGGMLSKIPHIARKKLPLWFDSNGLRFDINHLQSIDLKEMLAWDYRDMANYVDAITYSLCHNKVKQIDGFDHIDVPCDIDFDKLNTTSLGNIAYTSLYHSSTKERQKAVSLLIKIRTHYNIL